VSRFCPIVSRLSLNNRCDQSLSGKLGEEAVESCHDFPNRVTIFHLKKSHAPCQSNRVTMPRIVTRFQGFLNSQFEANIQQIRNWSTIFVSFSPLCKLNKAYYLEFFMVDDLECIMCCNFCEYLKSYIIQCTIY